jgi:hypothetical protein
MEINDNSNCGYYILSNILNGLRIDIGTIEEEILTYKFGKIHDNTNHIKELKEKIYKVEEIINRGLAYYYDYYAEQPICSPNIPKFYFGLFNNLQLDDFTKIFKTIIPEKSKFYCKNFYVVNQPVFTTFAVYDSGTERTSYPTIWQLKDFQMINDRKDMVVEAYTVHTLFNLTLKGDCDIYLYNIEKDKNNQFGIRLAINYYE